MSDDLESKLKNSFEKSNPSTVVDEIQNITTAFHDVPVDQSPSKGKYFPFGTLVKIKSLDVFDIKNYSKMDLTVNSSVESHIDNAMSKNMRVIFPNGQTGNYNDLTQFDRIHYLFLIREATMRNFKSKKEIIQTVKNPNNQNEEKRIAIDHNIFEYHNIATGVEKWYSQELRCYHILDTKEEPAIDLKIYIPTVGTINWIKTHIRSLEVRKHQGEEIFYDENFYKYLQFLVEDFRLLNDEYVKNKQEWFESLSIEESEILIGAIDKITIGIKPTIKVKFDDEEVIIPIRFRDYKSIFSISDRSSILLSDTE